MKIVKPAAKIFNRNIHYISFEYYLSKDIAGVKSNGNSILRKYGSTHITRYGKSNKRIADISIL